MTYPVMIPLGPISLHPHFLFEALAYAVGYAMYARARRVRGDVVADRTRTTVLVGAALGAALGSKLLAWGENWGELMRGLNNPSTLLGGKSVVGGLLGGKIGVEIAKRRIGETRRTGDLFAVPICVAVAIGRIGCFLTGLSDHTFGVPTTLPWGVDFGDGIPRHPTQLYEIAAVLGIAVVAARYARTEPRRGAVFSLVLFLYLTWRFAIDFLKPEPSPLAGLGAIQWACACGLAWIVGDWIRERRAPEASAHG